ncbi:MAG: ABC transporter substrate-binding protein [Thermomicrobiales bacterium]
MSRRSLFSRRRFLQVSGSVGFAVAASGRGGYVIAQEGTPVVAMGESPMLAAQVAAGTLPALAERMPINPMVVKPHEMVGKYGGRWRTALVGGADTAWLGRTVGYDFLVRYSIDWNEVIPNIAESFEASDDATSYTFKLREGMKWSDGAPFTADDIMFYIENVSMNPELTTSRGTNPFTGTKVDDYTVTITFERPNGLFLTELATPLGSVWTQFPKHYLSQFHKDLNTTNLDDLVADAGVADWVELCRTKGYGIPGTPYDAVWSNPELPRLHGWRLIEPYGDTTRVFFERNPYYFKVDTAGNQLPYIDEVAYDVLQDTEVLLLKAASGELDMHVRHIVSNVNKPVLAEASVSGGYTLFDTQMAAMNVANFNFNMTHPDVGLREVFASKDFRIGMSLGLDRQSLIDTVYVSQGEPWQWCPRIDTPWYNETLAKQFTEFDVALANEHLDRIMPTKDADGWRLRPDGQKFVAIIDVVSGGEYAHTDLVNIAVDVWRTELGVDVTMNSGDRSLQVSRADSNQSDCFVWVGDGGLQDAVLYAHHYLPMGTGARWAEAWYVWYENPASPLTEAQEPPEAIKAQFALYDQLKESADPAMRDDLFNQILVIAQEEFWGFGTSLFPPGYGLVINTMKNVPVPMINAYYYPTPGPTNPEQYFFDV